MAPKRKTEEVDKSRKRKKTTKQVKEEVDVQTVATKGKATVDSYCAQKIGVAHVFCEEQNVWAAMLNQANLQNNENKYYLIQLLEDDVEKKYSIWLRWGRVGFKGQNELLDFGRDLGKAKKFFREKFQKKTKNNWDERDKFKKVGRNYELLKMDYIPADEEVSILAVKKSIKTPACTLDKRVQALIELIFNVKAMEETVLEMKYDSQSAPLGNLTTEQIKAGYVALKKIEKLVNDGKNGKKISALRKACNNFYTRIPHNCGMNVLPLIETKNALMKEINLLGALGNIQIAMQLLNEVATVLENPVDGQYRQLECSLKPIEQGSKMFNIINEYLQNTHEKKRDYQMELVDVFECNKGRDEDKKFAKLKNRMLLWHGSRLTNYVGILKQGLRIAPPEAPATGYFFGKGVYFADRSSKSAFYCCTTRNNNTGLMLLCEVALGNIKELSQRDYNADQLPRGKNSVKGLGKVIPNPLNVLTMENGATVPYGKGCHAPNAHRVNLNHNEYVVYDTKRIKLRYLVKVTVTKEHIPTEISYFSRYIPHHFFTYANKGIVLRRMF